MFRVRQFFANLGVTLAAIGLAGILLMIGLYAAGYPAHDVLYSWVKGAVGSRFDFMVAVKNSCPLILTGLAAGVAFRSGVFNIGAEGQSILGAVAAAALATRWLVHPGSRFVGIALALIVAMLAGAGWAAIASLLDRYRKVPIVLSTILLNFIAVQLLGILLEGPLKAGGTQVVQSDPVGQAYFLPLLSQTGSLHAGILIALVAAGVLWVLQSRTSFGFELHAVGLNPVAARLAGMPVRTAELSVMLLSGAFAGLAGAVQLLGVSHTLGTDSPGYGYTGIAVALLGRLHPAAIVAAALFFSLLDQGAANVEISQYELPHEVADIVKGLVVILILMAASWVSGRRLAAKER